MEVVEDDEDDEVVDGITTLVEMVLKTEVKSVIGEEQVIGLKMVIFLGIIRVFKIEAMMDILVLLIVRFRRMESLLLRSVLILRMDQSLLWSEKCFLSIGIWNLNWDSLEPQNKRGKRMLNIWDSSLQWSVLVLKIKIRFH